MTKLLFLSLAAATAMAVPAALPAQSSGIAQQSLATRLDISATGTVSRVPDLAIISAGVVTKSATATGAIADNAARMERVRAALRRAGIADKDIQTSSINLNPDYRYENNQAPVLTGYQASNNVSVKFRDIRNSGKILDALVAEGANQLNGPSLTIDKPESAYDEARIKAIAPVGLGPNYMLARWGCGLCGWSRSARAAEIIRGRRCRCCKWRRRPNAVPTPRSIRAARTSRSRCR